MIYIILLLSFVVTILAFKISKVSKTHTEELLKTKEESDKEKKLIQEELSNIKNKFSQILDIEAEANRIKEETENLKIQSNKEIHSEIEKNRITLENARLSHQTNIREFEQLNFKLANLRMEYKEAEESAELREFGFYKPIYNFPDASRYQIELEKIRQQQKEMIRLKTAAVGHIEWTVNGSVVEGRKQINQTLRLLLRAFNGECDAAIAKVKYNNLDVMSTRIYKSFEAINKLADTQRCDISQQYLELKQKELRLVHEYQEKLYEEKEEQRRIREEMREEEIAQRELERAKDEAEKEEKRFEIALEKARLEVDKATGAKQEKLMHQIEELQRLLREAQDRKERAIARAQMTRSGHVYIISNIGSFGENVYKIGMTRRLDPMDRVRELGDASVPFSFDVHAIIFTEDAPKLENELHKAFHKNRLNCINERKEFFHVDIESIENIVKKHNAQIEITKIAEAKEYRQTVAMKASGVN